jgi:hypothetical protein
MADRKVRRPVDTGEIRGGKYRYRVQQDEDRKQGLVMLDEPVDRFTHADTRRTTFRALGYT